MTLSSAIYEEYRCQEQFSAENWSLGRKRTAHLICADVYDLLETLSGDGLVYFKTFNLIGGESIST